MPSCQSSCNDRCTLGHVHAALGFEPRPQRNVGQVAVTGQSRIGGRFDVFDLHGELSS